MKLLLILTSLLLASCSILQAPPVREVSIHAIPTLPSIIIPKPVPTHDLSLPTPITITAEEALYYRDACGAFNSGEYTDDELREEFYGLTQSSSCDWSITGFTVQDWFNVESKLALTGTYTQQLRDRIVIIEGIIKTLEDAGKRQVEAIKKIK